MLTNRGLALVDLQGYGVGKETLYPNLCVLENVPQSCTILFGSRAVTLERIKFTALTLGSKHDLISTRPTFARCVGVGEW